MNDLETEPKWTHKGWAMFCPAKFANTYSDEPIVAARWWFLEPLFTVAGIVQGIVILLCSWCIEDYEPQFWFKITGELSDNG